jgi:PAS domain S-box-containing protein
MSAAIEAAPVQPAPERSPSARRPWRRRASLPLQQRITASMVILLLPLVLLFLLEHWRDYQQERDTVLDNLTRTAQTLALTVEATFERSIVLGQALAEDPAIRALDVPAATGRLRAIADQQPVYENLALLDASGTLLTSAMTGPAADPRPSFAHRDYYQRLVQTRRPQVIDLTQNSRTGGASAGVAVPVVGETGVLAGLLVLVFDGEVVGQRLREVGLRPGQSILVADRNARIAFFSDPVTLTWEQRDARAYPTLQRALAGEAARSETVTARLQGDQRVGVAVPVSPYGWAVGMSLPTAEAFGALEWTLLQRLLALGLVALLALAASVWLTGSVLRPMQQLETQAIALGNGQLDRRVDISTDDDFGRLATAFNTMAERLQLALDEQRRSEERFRLAVEAIHGHVYDWELRTGRTYRSAGLRDVIGFAPEEADVQASWWTDRVHPDDLPEIQARRREHMARRTPTFEGEYRVRHRDGRWVWVREHSRAMYGEDGQPIRIVGSTWSIDAERRALDALRASEQRLQLAIHAARMVAWEWDPHADRVTTTDNLAEVYGVPGLERAEEGFALVHPDDLERHRGLVEQAVQTGKEYFSQFRIVRPDTGDIAWMEERGQAILGPDGHVVRLVGVVTDITARKQAELERAWLVEAVANSADSVIVRDLNGTILGWNPGAERLFGYTAEELIGRSVTELVPAEHRHEVAAFNARVARGERLDQVETVRQHKDGTLLQVAMSLSPIRDRSGRVVALCAIGRDITERKRLEEELEERRAQIVERERQLRRLAESGIVGVIFWHLDGGIQEANDEFLRIVGYTREDLEEGRLDWRALTPPEHVDADAARVLELHERGMHDPYEKEYFRKDGSRAPVLVGSAFFEGSRERGLSFILDLTERKQLERLQQEFIANVSHELRNPLAAIRGFAQLMQRRASYNERSVQAILGQTGQLERLIGDLLDASRLEAGALELRPERLDLVELARTLSEEAQATTEQHTIRLDAPPGPVVGVWDRDRLGQIVRNLLGNAVKYSPDGGEILVRIEDHGDTAQVSIKDGGIGMEVVTLEYLFGRFYRANAVAGRIKGVGLGLYITRELVEAHGGHIWAESAGPGQGSSFHFTLPRRSREDASAGQTQVSA